MPYFDVYDALVQFVDDPQDVEIILDAHHVGLKIDDMILITGDCGHIYSQKEGILAATSFMDIKCLGRFGKPRSAHLAV